MKKLLASGLLTVGVLTVAGPALASGTAYTVQVGSLPASAGDQRITAASTTSMIHATRSSIYSCSSSSAPSDASNLVSNSPSVKVLRLASLGRVNFAACTFFGGSITVSQIGRWELHAASGVTSGPDDVVNGHLDDVRFSANNLACKYAVSGRATATFDEKTQMLRIKETGFTGNLTVDPGASCGSDVIAGQAYNLSGSLQVKVAGDQRINIKP